MNMENMNNIEKLNNPETKEDKIEKIEENMAKIKNAFEEIDKNLKESPDRLDTKRVVLEKLAPVLGEFMESDEMMEFWLDQLKQTPGAEENEEE